MGKTIFKIMAAAALCLPAACIHPLSPAARRSVNPGVTFEVVREHPAAHVGKTLLLCGLVIANETTASGSELEILSYRLGLGWEPAAPRKNGGRFLARTEEFLDPLLFAKNRLVTLTGTFEGETSRPLAGQPYRYPLFRIGEIHLWPERRSYPEDDYYFYRHPFYPWPYYDPFYPGWYYRDWYYRDYYRRRRR
ncbi:MAG: Slp family lipoprotein [Deltaproteobacteria bacterium]|nr:Slp family lipoprotein [Deltaproteobacteria bacterium]